MSSKEVTIISIAGKQNAGKTTLIKDLIPKLKKQGYRVGTLKYNIKKFNIDHEGKDTYKYYHSGADSVALSSENEIAIMKKVANPPTLNEIIETHLNDVNVVLVEGYRGDDYPGIKIVDTQETQTVSDSDNELVLINEKLETKRFSEKNVEKALGFIEKSLKIT